MTFTKLQTAQRLQKLLWGAGCIQKHYSTLILSWAILSISCIPIQGLFVGTTTFPRFGSKAACRHFALGADFRNLVSRNGLLGIRGHAASALGQGMLLLVPSYLLSNKASSVLRPVTHLSVRALLWVSLAAWRSSSRRLLSVSSLSTSPRVHFLGLINRISFKSSSFSLISIRRSRSESSMPGQASLSSLASCIFRFAILQQKIKKKSSYSTRSGWATAPDTQRCTTTKRISRCPEEGSRLGGSGPMPSSPGCWQATALPGGWPAEQDFNSGLLPVSAQSGQPAVPTRWGIARGNFWIWRKAVAVGCFTCLAPNDLTGLGAESTMR